MLHILILLAFDQAIFHTGTPADKYSRGKTLSVRIISPSTTAKAAPLPSTQNNASTSSLGEKPLEHGFALPREYFEIGELDKPIHPITNIQPPPPEQADFAGKMTLDLYLDESGNVRSVLVHESNAPERIEQTTIETFLNARFEPGIMHQTPVKVHLRIALEFVPESKSDNITQLPLAQ